ncbi:MAG TPA: PhzF family phenazine biosynthesis protein [bacterium]|nr:PhzF family phenazine biosynthesis protein [bacterium]
MKFELYHVDAFTDRLFTGNHAGVCLLESWPDDDTMRAIAAENGVSETAFLMPQADGFAIRWFTPTVEVALCGHATLASAFVLFNYRGWAREQMRFVSRQSGELRVGRRGELMVLDFPARPPRPQAEPAGLAAALGCAPQAVLGSAEDMLVVLVDEQQVRELQPDFAALAAFDCRGVIVTARGGQCDFVSRFFAPRLGVAEDPVTGSAHCVLTPYWAGLLGRKELHARQLSARGGELFCTDAGERVLIAGRAVLYLQGRAAW